MRLPPPTSWSESLQFLAFRLDFNKFYESASPEILGSPTPAMRGAFGGAPYSGGGSGRRSSGRVGASGGNRRGGGGGGGGGEYDTY